MTYQYFATIFGAYTRIFAIPCRYSTGPENYTQTEDSTASLRASLCRTRKSIETMALGNDWEIFTTIAPSNDRNGNVPTCEEVRASVAAAIKRFAKRCRRDGYDFRYLGILEQGGQKEEDAQLCGRWHMHFLMSGIPPRLLDEYITDGANIPAFARMRQAHDVTCGTIPAIAKDIGYVFYEKIYDKMPLINYLNKRLYPDGSDFPPKIHRVMSSRGLRRPETKATGIIDEADIETLFQNAAIIKSETKYGKSIVCPTADAKSVGIMTDGPNTLG